MSPEIQRCWPQHVLWVYQAVLDHLLEVCISALSTKCEFMMAAYWASFTCILGDYGQRCNSAAPGMVYLTHPLI